MISLSKKESLQKLTVPFGSMDWGPRKYVGKAWFQTGTFFSPNGICLVVMQATNVTIRTIATGQEYVLEVAKPMTPRSVSLRCSKLLKELKTQ